MIEHKPQNEAEKMDLIQLMGSPSLNRDTLGKVGFEGLSETVGLELGKDFSAQLKAAIFDGQDKEVNPDGLNAQLVALDLNLGQLPVRLVGNEQELSLDFSFGKISDSASESVSESADVDSGFQIYEGFCGVPHYVDSSANGQRVPDDDVVVREFSFNLEKVTDLVNRLPEGELKSKLVQSLEILKSGNIDRKTLAQLSSLFEKFVHAVEGARSNGDSDVQFNELRPIPRPVLKNSHWGVSETVNRMATGSRVRDLSSETGARNQSVDVDRSNVAEYAPALSPEISKALAGLLQGIEGVQQTSGSETLSKVPRLGEVGYQQTGQGRPNDRDWELRFGSRQEAPQISPARHDLDRPKGIRGNMTIQEGKVISLERVSDLIGFESPLNSAEVIESIAGRLTKESIATQPRRVESSVIPLDTDLQANQIKVDASDKAVLVDSDSEQAATEFSSELAKGGLTIGKERTTAVFEAVGIDLAEDEKIEVSEEFSVAVDEASEVSREFRTTDSKLNLGDKTAAEQAIRNARNELTQAVLDIAAAKRPQNIKILLTPFELGTIDVSVRSAGGRVDVDLRASDDAVRQGLIAQRGDLVQSIESKGATVSSMNVGHHSGQQLGQGDGQGGQQATRDDFRQAVTLGQFSTNADTPAVSGSSYGTTRDGRVDLAA